MQKSQITSDHETFTDSSEKELELKAKYHRYRVIGPYNTLGYGLFGLGLANILYQQEPGPYYSLFPIKPGDEVIDISKIFPNINEIKNEIYPVGKEGILVWHLTTQSITKRDRNILCTHFETSELTKEEESAAASRFNPILVSSKWAVDIIKEKLDYKSVFCINGPCNTLHIANNILPWTTLIDNIKKYTNPESPVFLSSGKWESRKSHPEIIQAIDNSCLPVTLVTTWYNPFLNGITKVLKHLAVDHDWTLKLEGHFMNNKLFIFENKHKAHIVILPRIDNCLDYYSLLKSCDIYLGVSKGEGWDMPVVEAMGLGTPVILTKNTAHLEYLYADDIVSSTSLTETLSINCEKEVANDGIFFHNRGFWMKPNQEQLEHCITFWHKNFTPELKLQVGQVARKKIEQICNPDRIRALVYKAITS